MAVVDSVANPVPRRRADARAACFILTISEFGVAMVASIVLVPDVNLNGNKNLVQRIVRFANVWTGREQRR
jgi:hypothetical protein